MRYRQIAQLGALLCAVACSSPVADTAEDLVWDWSGTETYTPPDPLALTEVDALLTAAFDHLHSVDGAEIIPSFVELVTDIAEAGCPSFRYTTNYTDMNGSCTTSAGIDIFMDMRLSEGDTGKTDGGVETLLDTYLNGETAVVEGGEVRWHSATVFDFEERITADGVGSYYAQLLGAAHVPGASGWMGEHLSFSSRQSWYTEPDGQTPMAVILQGGMGNLTSGDLAAYNFVDWALMTEESGGPCSVEPAGSVELYATDGGRYTIVFDGVDPQTTAEYTDASECDGEAEVFFFDASLGRFSPDLSALMAWDTRPW